MLIPCQYGIMRRGESSLYSNNTLFDNEFGICLLGAIFMALTNPGRYVQFDELDSLCIGTEATPSVDDGYSHSIIIDLLFGKDKKLEIGFVEKKECYAYRGAITGFKPPLIM